MSDEKFLDEIVGKKINFLIGAGASSGWLDTLKIGSEESKTSLEEVYTDSDNTDKKILLMALFFDKSVKNGLIINDGETTDSELKKNINNYKTFIGNIVNIANMSGFEQPKRINVFTTNYDTFFENAFDELALNNPLIKFNDGSSGFFKRAVSYKNYYFNYIHSGSSDYFRREIPSINLYKIHGSLTWKKYNDLINSKNNKEYIMSDFSKERAREISDISQCVDDLTINSKKIKEIEEELQNKNDPSKYLDTIVKKISADEREELKSFNLEYEKLLIVNPTKRKFAETIFEDFYYQMLRALSNELEKKGTVLIVFGFSFKDEHILDIIHRAQFNPELRIFVIPYSENDIEFIKEKLSGFKNVEFVSKKNKEGNFKNGDFKEFNLLLSGESND